MRMLKGIAILGGIALLLLLVSLIYSLRSDVQEITAWAQSIFPGDQVEALSALAVSEGQSLKRRDRAIWALGHLADARALTALETLKTDAPCDHTNHVCQYELEKALAKIRGEEISLIHTIVAESP